MASSFLDRALDFYFGQSSDFTKPEDLALAQDFEIELLSQGKREVMES